MDRPVRGLERSAHGILAAYGRQAEVMLHLQGAEKGGSGLAPRVRVGGHPFEIFLAGEAHRPEVSSGRDHLAAGLHE